MEDRKAPSDPPSETAVWEAYERTQSIRRAAELLGCTPWTVWKTLHKDPGRMHLLMQLRQRRAADDTEYLADALAAALRKDLRDPDKLAAVSVKDKCIALGILTEKALLLRGQATQITGMAVDGDAVLADLIQQIERAGGMIRLPPQTVQRLVNKGLLPKEVLQTATTEAPQG